MVWQDYITQEIDRYQASKPSNNTALTSRLDTGTQIGLTGSYTTNQGANRVTAQPVAARTVEGPNPYAVAGAAFDAGYNTQDAGALVGGISSNPAIAGSGVANLGETGPLGVQAGGGGAGGRSRYTDEQIAFMIGGSSGGSSSPTSTRTGSGTGSSGGANTGGGGSNTGGGGGGTGTPAPTAPVGPDAPTSGAGDNFGQYTEAEIDAALRGIEAEFGMTREQLLQDKSMIGAQYRLLMARMARAREQAIGSATSDAVSRGIYRSGILGENIADVEQQYTEQQGGARQQQQIQEQTLERQLALLDQGQAAAGAQAQNQILGQAAATMGQAGVGPAGAGFTQGGFAPGAGGVPTMTTAPTPVPQGNPYEGFPIVGGYYIDPNTQIAVGRAPQPMAGVQGTLDRAQPYY